MLMSCSPILWECLSQISERECEFYAAVSTMRWACLTVVVNGD